MHTGVNDALHVITSAYGLGAYMHPLAMPSVMSWSRPSVTSLRSYTPW